MSARLVVPLLVALTTGVALERSLVSLPQRAGRFTYERSRVDDKSVPASVRADYEALDKPGDPWIALHIVPNAKVGEREAVQAEARVFEDSMIHNPALTHLTALPPAAIRVPAPCGAEAELLGSRQSFTYMDRDGQMTRHAGLVFHRDDFDFEVRVRVAVDDISQADFDTLADEAAREIVPKVGVRRDEAACVHDVAGKAAVEHVLSYPR